MKPDAALEIVIMAATKWRDVAARLGFSMSELRRLVDAGAIERVEGAKVAGIDEEVEDTTYKIGKHRFVRFLRS